ncbi:carbohydrate ABC transporter permease [Scatolibacter rhodanostii]|uniref:carbohydrate ABC transporter permease n=1 Tax=Scatolibacter rhodanostii TaxID=2014781 RepID=UPI000C08B180|nr:carbohydrate ABC transporter permease [Scatolibacter rhodanostii]
MTHSLIRKRPSTKIKRSGSRITFDIFSYVFIACLALLCLLPFIMLVSGSFTSEQVIRFEGYSLLPKDITLEAYKIIFKTPQKVFNAYAITILITAAGTFFGLMFITMTAYVLGRQDFKYRNKFSFFYYFTTLFNGGMISTYIFYIQYLNLKDNLLALILPGMINVFYLLIMRSFVTSIPTALIESAKIDGAGEFRTFFQIVLPLLKSGLATIGLFLALGYWNDWYNAMLYINTEEKYPLQYMLYAMMQKQQALNSLASQANIKVENLPSNSLKLAMAVVATGPIILLYPFVQKYFVKGITIGSVKG